MIFWFTPPQIDQNGWRHAPLSAFPQPIWSDQQDYLMFPKASSTEVCRARNFSNRTSLTVWVTRAFVTICKVPPAVWACLASCTRAPKPELSTKSICERSRIMCFGPSSILLLSTLRNVGSENASNKPVRRNSWQLSRTSRVPLRLTVRFSGSAITPSSSSWLKVNAQV